MTMVSLKMSKKDLAEETSPSPADQNPFPYGARLDLDTDELAKLGIYSKNLPEVGDEYQIRAIGKVTRVSEDETAGSDYRCGVCIQITDLELVHDGESGEMEDYEGEKGEAAERSTLKTVARSTYRG